MAQCDSPSMSTASRLERLKGPVGQPTTRSDSASISVAPACAFSSRGSLAVEKVSCESKRPRRVMTLRSVTGPPQGSANTAVSPGNVSGGGLGSRNHSGTLSDRERQAAFEHRHAPIDPRKTREGTRRADLRKAHAPVESSEIAPRWVDDDLARQSAAVLPGRRRALRGAKNSKRAAAHPWPPHESGNGTEKRPSRICGAPDSIS